VRGPSALSSPAFVLPVGKLLPIQIILDKLERKRNYFLISEIKKLATLHSAEMLSTVRLP